MVLAEQLALAFVADELEVAVDGIAVEGAQVGRVVDGAGNFGSGPIANLLDVVKGFRLLAQLVGGFGRVEINLAKAEHNPGLPAAIFANVADGHARIDILADEGARNAVVLITFVVKLPVISGDWIFILVELTAAA